MRHKSASNVVSEDVGLKPGLINLCHFWLLNLQIPRVQDEDINVDHLSKVPLSSQSMNL